LRYYLEAAIFFSGMGFFRLFGVERASNIGGWIGRTLISRTPASHRARANLALAFPEKSEAEIEHIVRAMWSNLGRVGGEYAYLPLMHSVGPNPRIQVSGLKNVEEALKRGKGIIPFSGHFANWEVLAYAVKDHGIVGGTIVRPTNNPHVNRWLKRMRAENGMPDQIPKGPRGTRRVFTLLRNHGHVCMMVDQRASEGIPAVFFGREVMTTPLPAALALKLGVSLLPVSNERLPGARFHVHFHPLIEPPDTGDYQRDLLTLTAKLTEFIEARVRERPEQWLWIHKRWQAKGATLRKRAQAVATSRKHAISNIRNP
jgi:KDO2-lipid IV(A) lauroyltransferase